MAAERLLSPRARATALAVAFSVVAGGAALVAIPQIATAVEEGDATASGAVTTADTAIPVSGEGFTPGNVVYAQVLTPSGAQNWSWNSAPFTAAEDGTVVGELTSENGFEAGAYTITLFESDEVQQTFTVDVVEADDATPTLTGEPSDPPAEGDDEAEAEADAEGTDDADGVGDDGAAGDDQAAGDADAAGDDNAAGDDQASGDDQATGDADAEGDGGVVAPPVDEGDDDTGADAPDDDAQASGPTASAEQDRYTSEAASADGISYHLAGFTPGVELQLVLTLPSGDEAEFASNEPIVPAEDGTYVGVITYSGVWPAGDYTVSVRTADGAMIPVDLTPGGDDVDAPEGETGPVGDDGESTGTPGDSDEDATRSVSVLTVAGEPAPHQEATFTFAVDAPVTGGAGSGGETSGTTGGSGNEGGLASTGGDIAFGAIGLGLLVVGTGAIVLLSGRFFGRRRDA